MAALKESAPITADMVMPIAREVCGADIKAFNDFAGWYAAHQGYLLNRVNA